MSKVKKETRKNWENTSGNPHSTSLKEVLISQFIDEEPETH